MPPASHNPARRAVPRKMSVMPSFPVSSTAAAVIMPPDASVRFTVSRTHSSPPLGGLKPPDGMYCGGLNGLYSSTGFGSSLGAGFDSGGGGLGLGAAAVESTRTLRAGGGAFASTLSSSSSMIITSSSSSAGAGTGARTPAPLATAVVAPGVCAVGRASNAARNRLRSGAAASSNGPSARRWPTPAKGAGAASFRGFLAGGSALGLGAAKAAAWLPHTSLKPRQPHLCEQPRPALPQPQVPRQHLPSALGLHEQD